MKKTNGLASPNEAKVEEGQTAPIALPTENSAGNSDKPGKESKMGKLIQLPGWKKSVRERSLANLKRRPKGCGPEELKVPVVIKDNFHRDRLLNSPVIRRLFAAMLRDYTRPRRVLMERAGILTKGRFYANTRMMMAYGWVERHKQGGQYYYRLTEEGLKLQGVIA